MSEPFTYWGQELTSLDTEPRGARLDSLTGLRFIAAFAVLLRHTVPEIFPLPGLLELSLIGPIGVGFFFVLSGFVLTWAWNPRQRAGQFYFRRVSRIGPLHVLTTILAVAYLVMQGTPYWFSSFLSLFLLHAWGPESWRLGGNGPSWSLSVEAFFYVCFPFLIRPIARLSNRRCAAIIIGVFVLMIGWTAAYGVGTKLNVPNVTIFSTYTNPAYRLGEFVIGIALALAIKRGWRIKLSIRKAALIAGCGYVALAALNAGLIQAGLDLGGTRGLPLGVLDLIYLPLTVILIASAAGADLRGQRSPFNNRVLVRLGEWSFALYLVQMIAVIPLAGLAKFGAVTWQGAILLLLTMAVTVALSAALFLWFEKPVERALNRRFLHSAPASAVPLSLK